MSRDKNILFVDDQAEILILLEKILEGEEYGKFFTSSVEGARKIIETEKINALVTDLIMPDVSGLFLLEEVKLNHPDIVRIVLSGHSQIPAILSAINRGDIWRFITKPWKANGEAKALFREALEYSDFLESKKSCLYSNTVVEYKHFTEIFKEKHIDFFLYDSKDSILDYYSEDKHELNEDDKNEYKVKHLNGFLNLYIK